MNLAEFFKHWGVRENPFRGEEARHDEIFARIGRSGGVSTHSEFEKILGELRHPSTAVVFGEKGSGKTAIRLQITDRVREHNREHPDERVFVIPYDDLNPFLERFATSLIATGKAKDPAAAFAKYRLTDHADAMLALATGRVVNGLIGGAETPPPADLGEHPDRVARSMPMATRRDLLLLQAVYDEADVDGSRTARLRRALRLPVRWGRLAWLAGLWLGWAPFVAALVWVIFGFGADERAGFVYRTAQALAGVGLIGYLLVAAKVLLWDRLAVGRVAGRIERQLRTLGRPREAVARSLSRVEGFGRAAGLPVKAGDEGRYLMLDRLRRVLAHFGYTGVLVLIDRVDEPALVNGDPDRMRAIIWPLFNSKFLQQERFGLKMLLPIELRHAMFKESSAFFQEARLDKQNLVERLSWTGAMLYDLCSARLRTCMEEGAEPIGLLDIFGEDVTRQDLVDALDQMHQPRDAFKFLYRCLTEHCSNVTAEESAWRVPRLVLEHVRKQESDRVQQLERGIRPA